MDGIVSYMAFCDWLLSLGRMFLRFMCVLACISSSFWFFLFLHSFVGGHLGGFSFLVTGSRAAVSVRVQVFVWTLVVISLGRVPRSGIVGSYGHRLVFCGAARLLSRVAASLYLASGRVQCGGGQRLWQ